MKNLIWTLMVFGLFACSSATESEPDNYTTMPWVKLDKVESLVKKKPKKILVDVYTPWCGPCKMMDKHTFTDPEIMNQVGKNFYPVKFDAEGPDPINFKGKEYKNPLYKSKDARRNPPHQLASFFAVRGYPTLVVLDENMNIIDKIVGYKKPLELKAALSKYTQK